MIRVPRRDQGLALRTWELVESLPDEVRPQFRSRAMGLGAMLQGSGLAATAAFLQAKSSGGGALEQAYAALAKGLEEHVVSAAGVSDGGNKGFVRRIGKADVSEYRRMSAAADEFAIWIRRAAEALIPALEDR